MFVYNQWDEFCRKLKIEGCVSVTAAEVPEMKSGREFLILKHDVETNPYKALKLAEIESRYSHKGSYYVQAYLLKDERNISILKKIQALGHEVSYHHDVMDSNRGNLIKSKEEFQKNLELFVKHGFNVRTVCQHGNPVIERIGYSSNRDFFRNIEIQKAYSDISEIMVNYRSRINNDYKYISDAGRGWKVIHDPENNDLIDSSDKDIPIRDLDGAIELIKNYGSVIISTHPHRWNSNVVRAKLNDTVFKMIKVTAKALRKVPVIKKLMGKFYYLAKKI